jgi:hypothetical protein
MNGAETLEITCDVARNLIETQAQRPGKTNPTTIADSFNYPLTVKA